jgi:tetratricopeptide (TPR) repeat protein
MNGRRFIIIFVVLTMLAGLVVPISAQATCDPAVNNLAKAEAARDAGNYTASLAAYSCALEADPENASIQFERGMTGLLTPNFNYDTLLDISAAVNADPTLFDTALADSAALVEANPDSVPALVRRGYLLWRNVEDEAAVEVFDAILEIQPDNVFATLFRASSNQYLGNLEDAAADFERVATELAPDNAGAIRFIAETYADTQDYESTRTYYDAAIALDPTNASLYVARAWAYDNLGDSSGAEADYVKALSLRPTDATIREDMAWNYIRQGRYAEAIPMATTALVFDSTQLFSYLARGVAMTELGNTRGGAQDFRAFFLLNEVTSATAELEDGSATLAFEPGIVYSVALEAEAGDVVTISAVSADDAVDPLLLVLDANGIPLIGNDDAESLVDYNALISDLTLPTSGEYTILVTHAGAGDTGDVTLTVE